MFNTRFNTGYQSSYQNMNDPNMNMDQNGYMTMPQDPYAVYNPQPSIPYPNPPAETEMPPMPQMYDAAGYARGGNVRGKNYPRLAEMLRRQGNDEDTVLAHINPLEAMMLKTMGGSGTINPKTGLPQFGFFNKPGKATKSFFTKPKRALAETVGLGSAIFGGPLGGALGGAAKEAILGRNKNILSGALTGGLQGALIPGAARLAGSGLSSLGATGLGGTLENYGAGNMGSWLGNLGQVGGGLSGLWDSLGGAFGGGAAAAAGAAAPTVLSGAKGAKGSGINAGDSGEVAGKAAGDEGSFADRLLGNTGKYLSKPKNLLALASAASSFANRPKKEKPKTPEQIADEQKRLEKALRLSPAERKEKEADLLAEARMQRAIARNQFLPEERLGNLNPIYRKSHTPEEQKRYGRWFSHYDNPNFTGEPLLFKEGGNVMSPMMYEAEEISYPSLGNYIMGATKGQDDKVNAQLSDGEFVMPADVVSDLGDGNNSAGANELYKFMKNIRKHKRGGKAKLPPKAKSFVSYLK
jgi:hypothetical protein